ncbi:MAG: class I SAM-dependent rRNA methyltransferase [Alphaproteobacteria bacterium]|nr:class I SAM-dependent rRNA methyltransferase [Alphaproteobacteria bacterium]
MTAATLSNLPPASLPLLRLQKGRSSRLRAGHPWVFSNEIDMDARAKALAPGSLVRLQDAGDEILGTAYFNPHSLIAARLLSRNPDQVIDSAFIAQRIRQALALRETLFDRPFYRLIHAEADGLPGLIIDRFNDHLTVQANSAGAENLRPLILDSLETVLAPAGILWDGSSPVRRLEGLETCYETITGSFESPLEIEENGAFFFAHPGEGQKTGWFFDQRPNRALAANLSKGKSVLDLYSYAGGFGVLAACQGATQVQCVDRSAPALEMAQKAAERNGVAAKISYEKADIFEFLEQAGKRPERFGLVIADPPAFVKSKKDLAQGARGYRKLARLAASLVEPEGFLVIASCSHHMPLELFQSEVIQGINRRSGRILAQGGAGPDHPVHPQLPESAYLKALFLQLD